MSRKFAGTTLVSISHIKNSIQFNTVYFTYTLFVQLGARQFTRHRNDTTTTTKQTGRQANTKTRKEFKRMRLRIYGPPTKRKCLSFFFFHFNTIFVYCFRLNGYYSEVWSVVIYEQIACFFTLFAFVVFVDFLFFWFCSFSSLWTLILLIPSICSSTGFHVPFQTIIKYSFRVENKKCTATNLIHVIAVLFFNRIFPPRQVVCPISLQFCMNSN